MRNLFVTGIGAAAAEWNDFDLKIVAYPGSTTDFTQIIQAVKDTGFRYFLSLGDNHEPVLAVAEAYRQSIAGTGHHNWIINDKTIVESMLTRPKDTSLPWDEIGLGIQTYTMISSMPGTGRYNELADAWRELKNPQDVDV